MIPRAKLKEDVKTLGKGMVPRAGVEPARPFGQRILSPQRLPFRHPGTLSVARILPSLSSFPYHEYREVICRCGKMRLLY
jgi:hypothetical protein